MSVSGIPVFAQDFTLHVTQEESTLFEVKREKYLPRNRFGFRHYRQWKLPNIYARYLVRANGLVSHEQIASEIIDGFSALAEILADDVARSLQEIGALSFLPEPGFAPVGKITGGFESFTPLHMSFEITDTCNFHCDHCYVSASPAKHGRQDTAETIRILGQLADNGVRVVELTGGECTTHPGFRDILAFSASAFDIVAIISNGYLLGKKRDLLDFVASFDNVLVQISLDGTREYHDRFRNMQGSFDYACTAIKSLREKGVFVRISSSICEENLDQVVDIYKLSKQLDASTLVFAAVTSFGRGEEMESCSAMNYHVSHSIGALLKPYQDDPVFEAIRMSKQSAHENKRINCGAGWRSFALNSNGTVRSCLYLAESKKFGNLLSEEFGDIFAQDEMRMFREAPSPGGEPCRSKQPNGDEQCRHLGACTGCFAKAFKISEDEYPECPWRARYFPGMDLAMPTKLVHIDGASPNHGVPQR